MAYIYVYNKQAADCATIGVQGALMDFDAVFEQKAGEFGELTFKHPIDPWGKWRSLQEGRILKTDVPCRLPYEFDVIERPDSDPLVITLSTTSKKKYTEYRVPNTALDVDRLLYYADCPDHDPDEDDDPPDDSETYGNTPSGLKAYVKGKLAIGTRVIVLKDTDPNNTHNGRYKVRVTKGKRKITGYMNKAGLVVASKSYAPTVTGRDDWLEELSPSYAIMPQLFRIYSVETSSSDMDPGTIIVRARRLVYDLLGNISTYRVTGSHSGRASAKGILKKTVYRHPFTIESNIGDKRVGFDARDKNPIAALIDPEEGLVSRWGGEVFCDDYDIYYVSAVGLDRGVRIEYTRNLTGVVCTVDTSNVATSIRPVGRKVNGEPLYLDGKKVTTGGKTRYKYNLQTTSGNYLPSGYKFGYDKYSTGNGTVNGVRVPTTIQRENDGNSLVTSYAAPKCMVLEVSDAAVTKTDKDTDPNKTKVVTTAIARRLMVEAAINAFKEGCDQPEFTLDVDFTLLGDTEEYAQYRHLEPMFLYDTVQIVHKRLGISATMQLTGIQWSIRQERMIEATFGSLRNKQGKIIKAKTQSTGSMSVGMGTIARYQLSDYALTQGAQWAYDTIVRREFAENTSLVPSSDTDERSKAIIYDGGDGDDQDISSMIALGGTVAKVHIIKATITGISTSNNNVSMTFKIRQNWSGNNSGASGFTGYWWPGNGWTPMYIAGFYFNNDNVAVSRMYLNKSDSIIVRGRYIGSSSTPLSVNVMVHVACGYDTTKEYNATYEYEDEEGNVITVDETAIEATDDDEIDTDCVTGAAMFSEESTYDLASVVTYAGEAELAFDTPVYVCTTAVTTAGPWDASHWTELYSEYRTYAVGDIVYYTDGEPIAPIPYIDISCFYRCVAAIETPEPWTAAHWQQMV